MYNYWSITTGMFAYCEYCDTDGTRKICLSKRMSQKPMILKYEIDILGLSSWAVCHIIRCHNNRTSLYCKMLGYCDKSLCHSQTISDYHCICTSMGLLMFLTVVHPEADSPRAACRRRSNPRESRTSLARARRSHRTWVWRRPPVERERAPSVSCWRPASAQGTCSGQAALIWAAAEQEEEEEGLPYLDLNA